MIDNIAARDGIDFIAKSNRDLPSLGCRMALPSSQRPGIVLETCANPPTGQDAGVRHVGSRMLLRRRCCASRQHTGDLRSRPKGSGLKQRSGFETPMVQAHFGDPIS